MTFQDWIYYAAELKIRRATFAQPITRGMNTGFSRILK